MAGDWRDFNGTPSDNQGAPPIGTGPEGSFPGKWVNDILRNIMAAIRNLGDETLKIGPDMTGSSVAGTAALANVEDFMPSSGGAGYGLVPVGGVIPFWGTMSEAEAKLSGGWAVCDGRTVTNPLTSASVTTPDLRGRYARFHGATTPTPKSTGGSLSGTTGSTALTLAQLPAVGFLTDVTSDPTADVEDFAAGNEVGLNTDTSSGGGEGHTHTFSLTPTFATFIPLMRIA